MAYNSALFNAAFYNCAMFGPNAQQVADEAARLAAEDDLARDRMHYVARLRRERGRQALIAASTAMKPAPERVPLPPDPVLVDRIAAQLTNVRTPAARREGYGGGINLPFPFNPRR